MLFSTPPILKRLAVELNVEERLAISGVHYGGMPIAPDELNQLRSQFPSAVHLSGYGNTLFGCALEIADDRRSHLDYFSTSNRVVFEVVRPDTCHGRPSNIMASEKRGQLMFHRLDRSMFLPNTLERDWATLVQAPDSAVQCGWQLVGIRDPAPPLETKAKLQVGIS